MAFEKSLFIKPDAPFVKEFREENLAPLFRKRFRIGPFARAELRVCALGYGHFFLNGRRVTEDKFIAPVSDYDLTLWYTAYDVTSLLNEGENAFAASLGNGFFNESFRSSWNHNEMPVRDNPKLMAELVVDGNVALKTGDGWLCKPSSATTFNMLRSGEYFDARLYDPSWNEMGFDDSDWPSALVDDRPPKGVFRLCPCEPIRECSLYPTLKRWKVGGGRWVFDLGQNMMGYIRLKIRQKSGSVIWIRYAELLNEHGDITTRRMGEHFPESPFMTDRFTCDGNAHTWSPAFVYHGFRYIALDGLEGEPEADTVSGVFAHQDVALTSGFECADETLNRLFEIGRMATLSNLAYMPTDCPTREKLGWANDAQASCEQMLTNFGTEKFFRKWFVDVLDAMRSDGAMPGIIPTSGWGFDWGNGPVSDGILFELPNKLYLFTGDKGPLVEGLTYFLRYLDHLRSRAEGDGFTNFGLSDWAPPRENDPPRTPVKLINAAFECKFLEIAKRAARFSGDGALEKSLQERRADLRKRYMAAFLNPDGTCAIDEQTAVAMTIVHGLHDNLEPLSAQLLGLVEAFGFHHDCGMVGLPHLYAALDICGAPEYVYKILISEGYPSFRTWLEGDATTLWETWQCDHSLNHHMYSDFMSWLLKSLVGIRPTFDAPGFEEILFAPSIIEGLQWAAGHLDTKKGRIEASWRREGSKVTVTVKIPSGCTARVKLPGRPEFRAFSGEHAYTI